MPKTTTFADKEALLAKMQRDRQALAGPARRSPPHDAAAGAWARTIALAVGATLGWPPFLKQPLRAMAVVALRARLSEVLIRSKVRRVSGPLHDPNLAPELAADLAPDLARVAAAISDVQAATARSASPQEIEHLRLQLDAQVRRLRALRASPDEVCLPSQI